MILLIIHAKIRHPEETKTPTTSQKNVQNDFRMAAEKPKQSVAKNADSDSKEAPSYLRVIVTKNYTHKIHKKTLQQMPWRDKYSVLLNKTIFGDILRNHAENPAFDYAKFDNYHSQILNEMYRKLLIK